MLAALLIGLIGGHIEVLLAPDQPLPQVYVDEPLVVALTSTEGGMASIQLRFEQPGQPGAPVPLEPIRLHPGSPAWVVVKDAPTARGWYRVHTTIACNGAVEEQTLPLVRVDRPLESADPSAAVHLSPPYLRPALQAARGIGIGQARMRAGAPGFDALAENLRHGPVSLLVELDADAVEFPEALVQTLSAQYGSHIKRWDLQTQRGADALKPVVSALRESGQSAALAIQVSSPEELARLLHEDEFSMDMAIIDDAPGIPGQAQAFRIAAEMSGREGLAFAANCQMDSEAHERDPLQVVRQIARNSAIGAAQTLVCSGVLFREAGFAPGYPLVGAFLRRTHGMRYAFRLALEGPVEAHLFRRAGNWCLMVWRNTEGEVSIPMAGAKGLRGFDASGNPFEAPPPGPDAQCILQIGGSPIYLTGRGGALLPTGAQQAARREAHRFMEIAARTDGLPKQLISLVESVKEGGIRPGSKRERFLALLRAFPLLERQWHSGALPSATAVPAMASIARILRALCVTEEERGEPFLEPLQGTLDFCGRQQALYLTQSTAPEAGRDRGDWLMAEISRLVAQAEELSMAERHIEAAAVASIAEWRARALGFVGQDAPASEGEILASGFEVPGITLPAVEPAPPQLAPPGANDDRQTEAAPQKKRETDAISAAEETEEAETQPDPLARAAESRPGSAAREIFTVKAGDTPWDISRRHGITLKDLFEWNGWGEGKTLSIGEEYIVAPPEE